MLSKIVQIGDPVLRTVSRKLSRAEIRGVEIQGVIDIMRETMRDAPGVGLAAPQIGLPIQLAVIEDRRETKEHAEIPFHVIANPVLTIQDDAKINSFEGCLSVAGFSAIVPRATSVRVDALNHRGDPITIDASGWYARILQHEIDHLNGTVYIDRMLSRSMTTQSNLSHWVKYDMNSAESRNFSAEE